MKQLYSRDLSWYSAFSLAERAKLLLSQKVILNESDAQLAERRMQLWRTQTPFEDNSFFKQRLEIDALDEEKLLYLLGEPIEALQRRLSDLPSWIKELKQAECFNVSQNKEAFDQDFIKGQGWIGFLYIIEPLVNRGLDRLQDEVQTISGEYSNLPFDSRIIGKTMLNVGFLKRLFQIVSRTQVLELNVARMQGVLKGNSREDRFRNFLERQRQQEVALALLQEYPVLARQVQVSIDQWVNYSREFLQHLCADWTAINNTFSLNQNLGVLTKVEGNLGDTHREGRSVLIAQFSSGVRIVYKPRSLAAGVHFQELLTWLNCRGDHSPFRTLKMLDRSTYGWTEFVTAYSCSSKSEVQRFYQRQGSYLALLFLLGSSDFHLENLIAAGEHPVLIDLETLFGTHWKNQEKKSSASFVETFVNSVLRIGLLPQRQGISDKSDGIDLSALSAKEDQTTPYRSSAWQESGTDQMRFVLQQVKIPGSQNRPTLNNSEINSVDYVDEIIIGFTKVYRLLCKHRNELLLDSGPLARFAEDEVRVVIRPTLSYDLLLRESYHPDLLGDALNRDRLFEKLWFDVQYQPLLKKVIAAEREDLWRGDVPIFTAYSNSRDIWTSTGKRIPNFLNEPPLDLVQRRLNQLGEADLAQQLWFIRASLTTLVMNNNPRSWSSYSLTEPQHPVKREQLIAAACEVGDRLETLALNGEQEVNWFGLNLIKERYWSIAPLGVDLYNGMPGVALFMGYLGAVTKDTRYTTLAQLSLTTIRSQIERNKSFISSIGGFSGWGGLIYTLVHLGTLWNQPELLTEAEDFVELLTPLIEKDEQFDIISGSAGAIGCLLTLYHYRPSQHTLTAAVRCGEHLIANVQLMSQGKGWLAKNAGNKINKPLTGFSHGVAGIAWALLKLATLTNDKRFQQVAIEAIAYERSLFLVGTGNWPDLREFEDTVRGGNNKQITSMAAWCHGAPGIGLARLASLTDLDDAEIRAEIETALKTTLKQGFGFNHSLCHGDLGNIELILQASRTLNDCKWNSELKRLTGIIYNSIDREGWLCGVPLGVEVPGLMTGLAGIGYELLRLAKPEIIPSILTLAPPSINSVDCQP